MMNKHASTDAPEMLERRRCGALPHFEAAVHASMRAAEPFEPPQPYRELLRWLLALRSTPSCAEASTRKCRSCSFPSERRFLGVPGSSSFLGRFELSRLPSFALVTHGGLPRINKGLGSSVSTLAQSVRKKSERRTCTSAADCDPLSSLCASATYRQLRSKPSSRRADGNALIAASRNAPPPQVGSRMPAGWRPRSTNSAHTCSAKALRSLKVSELGLDFRLSLGRHSVTSLARCRRCVPAFVNCPAILEPPLQGIRYGQVSDLRRVREDFFGKMVRLYIIYGKHSFREECQDVIRVSLVLDDLADARSRLEISAKVPRFRLLWGWPHFSHDASRRVYLSASFGGGLILTGS